MLSNRIFFGTVFTLCVGRLVVIYCSPGHKHYLQWIILLLYKLTRCFEAGEHVNGTYYGTVFVDPRPPRAILMPESLDLHISLRKHLKHCVTLGYVCFHAVNSWDELTIQKHTPFTTLTSTYTEEQMVGVKWLQLLFNRR